jgi:hypothetical protein
VPVLAAVETNARERPGVVSDGPSPSRLDVPDECPPPNPPCISYTVEARYRAGYEHLVHVSNACEADAECTVHTDVNPNPIGISVKAGTTQVVVTSRRAPTPYFEATVDCSLAC